MNQQRDPERLIHAFLTEGPTELADQVFDAVRDTIEQKRQRVVIGPWRLPTMNKIVPIGLGAVAVVVVFVVGTQILGSPASSGVGGAPSATPSPTPSPTPEPSVATPSPSVATGLPVGSSFVLINDGGVRGTVTVPASGWSGDGGIMTKDDSGADPPRGAGMITFTGPLHVFGDPCRWSTTKPGTPAKTVDELVTALSAQASRNASAPVDITVGGYAGKSITLHVPDDAAFSQCDQGYFGGPPASSGSGGAASASPPIGGTVTFQMDGAHATTTVDAVADGASVSGTAVSTLGSGTHTVDVECAARDGDTWAFGGTIKETTVVGEPAGAWSAVVVRDGSPQKVGIWLSDGKAAGTDCDAWLAAIGMSTIDAENFHPVESGTLVPPPDLAP